MSEDGLTPEELNKRANEDWNNVQDKQNTPNPNVSLADSSTITHPDQDKRSVAEGIIAELGNHTNEIDSIKQIMKTLVDQQNQLATMVNQQTQAINQLAQGGQQAAPEGQQGLQGLNMEALSGLGDLLEKGVSAYKMLKGGEQGPAPLIDQGMINKEMTEAFFDNLNTGKSINNFVKDALKKKATKEIVNSTMKSLGQDEHAPQ